MFTTFGNLHVPKNIRHKMMMDEFVNYLLLLLVILPVVLFINLWAGIGWELFVNN